jgi:hypothetical protein
MKRKRRSWIRKIRRFKLREAHRAKLLRCHVEMFENNLALAYSVSPLTFRNYRKVIAEMLEDNFALALLPTLRNRKKVIAELKQEFEYWVLYGPISDEEKEKEEKDKKRTVGDFIKNWCSPSIEFKIFSYFAESPFKQQLIDKVTGDGQRGGWKDLGYSAQFRSHRENMRVHYTDDRERPWRFLCGELSCSGNSLRLKYAINPIVKLLWNVMRKKNSGKWKGFDYAMLSKDLYPILKMNNIGRNVTHRKSLASSVGWGSCGNGTFGRPVAVRLLMSI